MTEKQDNSPRIEKVQLVYARVLEMVSHVAMFLLAAGYLVYILQLLPPSVPIESISGNWHLSAFDMQQKLHAPSGWLIFSNTEALFKGDVVSYFSIFYLCMATIICLVFAAIIFFRGKNYLYAAITALQVLVLFFAASGLIH
jgi:uncharacterized membrane protein